MKARLCPTADCDLRGDDAFEAGREAGREVSDGCYDGLDVASGTFSWNQRHAGSAQRILSGNELAH